MTESDSSSNDNENSDIQESVDKLLSLPDYYREDVTKLFMSKKQNDISVIKEFMKVFKFDGMTVLDAFRVFNNQIMISGDSSQLLLITRHFSSRYTDCNYEPYCFERCEIIVSYILQLNTMLHKDNGRYAVTLKKFITFFKDMPPEYNFDKAFITQFYRSIKDNEVKSTSRSCRSQKRSTLNEFAESANDIKKVKNDVMNKRHFGAGFLCMRVLRSKSGKMLEKTLLWRKYFASLDDLSLSLYRDEDARQYFRNYSDVVSINSSCMLDNKVFLKFLGENAPVEVLPVHHCLARPILNHDNKFLIYMIDQSKYCFKVDTSVNVEFWNSTINYAAALLSKPNYVSMSVDVFKFGRVHYHEGFTKFDIDEQIISHSSECEVLRAQLEYIEALAKPKPINYASNVKFINNQIERFETYVRHLRITTKKPAMINFDDNNLEGEVDSISTYSSTYCQSETASKSSLFIESCSKRLEIGNQYAESPLSDKRLVIESPDCDDTDC